MTGGSRRDRAAELELAGFSEVAAAVAACKPDHDEPCETRFCVHCVDVRVTAFREVAARKLAGMERAARVHLVLPVGDLGFPGAWRLMRRALRRLRDWLLPRGLACFGVVFGDASDATMHGDLVLAVDRSLAFRELEEKWSYFTIWRGHVRSATRIKAVDPAKLARSLVQARRWCPVPGTVPVSVLHDLWVAGLHRRWSVPWRVVR